MAGEMQPAARRLLPAIAAALALAVPGGARSDPAPPPVKAAPSQYVEVVPTAGGGTSGGPAPLAGAGRPSAPGSAVGAAADAVTGDSGGALKLGTVLLGVAVCLVGAAAWRRRHVPNG
jgi:hypothetical protein